MAYNKNQRVVSNGTNIKVNEVKVDGGAGSFKTMFNKKAIDLRDKGISTYRSLQKAKIPYTNKTNTKIDGISVNEEVVKQLHSMSFYNMDDNPAYKTFVTPYTYKFQQQIGNKSATTETSALAWSNLQQLKTNRQGSLFVYDIETYGAKTKDQRWNPLGITEFAMNEYNFNTQQTEKTNILFVNDQVVSDLEKFLKKYETVMDKGGIEAIKKDEEMRVTAMRMTVYDPQKGARFQRNGNMWQAVALGSTDDAEIGNVDSIIRGIEQFKTMRNELKKENALINPQTGLSYDIEAFIQATGKMNTAINNQSGIVAGHNITNFDRPVVDKRIHQIFAHQQDIIHNPSSSKEVIEQARQAQKFISSNFKGSAHIGLSSKKGYTLDTLPIMRDAKDILGLEVPDVKLENLISIYHEDIAQAGVAHLGTSDVTGNMALILEGSDKLNGSTLIQHVMESLNGGLIGRNKNNPSIDLQTNQVFKAIKSPMSSNFSGKGYMNYIEYANGQIYTNGGFGIKGDKISHTDYAGNTGLNKNRFYQLQESNRVRVNALPKETKAYLKEAYPELNTDFLHHVSFSSVDATELTDAHTVHLFASTQEEMESLIGTHLAHVADIKGNKVSLIQENIEHITNATYNLSTKKAEISTISNELGLLTNAIKQSDIQYKNDAINRAVFAGDKKLKNINGLLSFDKEIRAKGLGDKMDIMREKNISLSALLKDKTAYKETPFTKKEVEQIKEAFTRHIGYKDKDKQNIIDFRTKSNVSAAYETVMDKKEYYDNLIQVTKNKFGIKKFDKNNLEKANDFFNALDTKATVEAAQEIGMGHYGVINAVTGSSIMSTNSVANFKNKYDFEIGSRFTMSKEKAQSIESPFSLARPDNIVTVDMSAPNAESKLINKLYALRMGDEAQNSRRTDIEGQKSQAVYEFLMDLNNNKKEHTELFKNKEFKKHMKKLLDEEDITGMAPKDFDMNIHISSLLRATKSAKESDIAVGIIQTVGDIRPLHSNKNMNSKLNNISFDYLRQMGHEVKTINTYDEKTQGALVQKLVDTFGFNDSMFGKAYSKLDDAERKTATLIRNDVNKKFETYFDDLITTTREHGIDLHIHESGRQLVVTRNGKQQILDKMPKAQIDNAGKMYLQSGADKIGLDLRLAVKETQQGKRTYVTTNLDENFGRAGVFEGLFNSRLQTNKTTSLSDLNRYTGYHNSKTREHSKYTGTKNDRQTINNRMDISAVYDLYPEIFALNGSLNNVLEETDLIDSDLVKQLRNPDNMRKMINSSKSNNGGISPDVAMLGINNLINVTKATLDKTASNYKESAELFDYMGMSLKETALVKGYVQIGDRVVGNWTNVFDNTQRPPMTGAGNIRLLDEKLINNSSEHNILPGAVLESNKTMTGITKEAEGAILTSDFRGRQEYISGPFIQKRMQEKKSEILKANIDNKTIKQMTDKQKEEVYNKLIETAGGSTFEQARLIDGRVFNSVVDMPIDSQFLSVNKDIIGLLEEDPTSNEKIQRLVELAGEITQDENGVYKYNRRAGTIVKKGETIAESKGYGGVKEYFGSKHDKGVLYFSVTDNKHHELTDDAISKIMNEHANKFSALETNEEKLNALFNILEADGLKAGYRIDNANQASLIKVLDMGSEKGMSLITNATIGQLNSFNKEYFDALLTMAGEDKYDMHGVVGRERTIKAIHEDIARKQNISTDQVVQNVLGLIQNSHNIKDLSGVIDMVKDERDLQSELLFGKHGAFNGVISIANDNILKHENMGLATAANFNEAVYKYAKAADISHIDATKKLASAMEENDDLNFIRKTIDGNRTEKSGVKFNLSDKGTLIVQDIENESVYLDNGKFNNLMLYANDLIESLNKNTPEEDKLVHKDVYTYNKKGELEHKQTLVGSFKFTEENGMKIAYSGTSFPSHSVVDDGETVSGVSQQYLDALKGINELKNRGDLNEVEKEKLRELQEIVNSQKDHAKFNRINDQGLVVLGRERFNDALEEDLNASLNLQTGSDKLFTKQKAEFLQRQTNGAIIYDKDNKRITINDSIKNVGANEIYIDKIKENAYYNELFADELTPEMLQTQEYSHLKDVYDEIVGGGTSEKLGVHQAQNIYDLQGMHVAAQFNGSTFDPSKIEEMQKQGFKIMDIKDYTPTEGSARGGVIESIRNERILLDLGDDFSMDKRYVAIPAGGQQIGDSEVLATWQGKINQLKRQSDTLNSLEGGGRYGGYSYQEWQALTPEQKAYIKSDSKITEPMREKYEKTLNNMVNTSDEIRELVDKFPSKGTKYSDAVTIEIPEAAQRLKMTSTTDVGTNNEILKHLGLPTADVKSSTFMQHAKVMAGDGTKISLFDLSKQGIEYDFARAGEDYFENAGYFKKEMLEKFNFAEKEQMVEYLKENGTVATTRRFPEILSTSIYQGRMYLDESLNGKNIISYNTSSMLKFNGDTDGDSGSSWNTTIDGVNFALFEHQRAAGIEQAKNAGHVAGTQEFEQHVRDNVINSGKVTADAYEGFKNMSYGMDVAAVYRNPKWKESAKETLLGDIANNISVGSAQDMIYQFKDAKSETFRSTKMEAMHIHPTGEQVRANVEEVKEAITFAMEASPQVFTGKIAEDAKSIVDGVQTISDIKSSSKYEILDTAMMALEENKAIDKDTFSRLQNALTQRVRSQQLFEEETAKSTKSAIGSINNMLNSLKVAGEDLFTNESSGLFNPNMSRVLYEGAYQAEQQVISGKKMAFEFGDTRLIELENIIGTVKRGKGGQSEKEQLSQWFTSYLGEGPTNTIWDEMRSSVRQKLESSGGFLEQRSKTILLSDKTLSQSEATLRAKNDYIAETMVDSISLMVNNKRGSVALRDIERSNKNVSQNSRIMQGRETGAAELITTQVNNMLASTTSDASETVIDAAKQTVSPIEHDAIQLSESLASTKSLATKETLAAISGGVSKIGGLGLFALGAAAGIMVAGYAGGGHQKPAKAQSEEKREMSPMLDDMDVPNSGMTQQGYVINVNAESSKGMRHLKHTLKDMAKASHSNGDVSINMNYKTTNGGGYSNKDIENIINNYI